MANESSSTFFVISSSDIMHRYLGDSENFIKKLFHLAREKRPSIIFFDEIDSIAMSRKAEKCTTSRRVMTEILTEMDGFKDNKEVFIIAATNLPDTLDSAFLRRFGKLVYVGLPNSVARAEMVKKNLKYRNYQDANIQETIANLTHKTKG